MPKLAMFKNPMQLRLSLMAAVLVFGSVPVLVPQGWWGRGMQGDCSGSQPKGASWLNWSGYYWDSWGQTAHNLSWHDNNRWIINASGDSGRRYGFSHSVVANSSAGYRAGHWAVASTYWANFATFSPPSYS